MPAHARTLSQTWSAIPGYLPFCQTGPIIARSTGGNPSATGHGASSLPAIIRSTVAQTFKATPSGVAEHLVHHLPRFWMNEYRQCRQVPYSFGTELKLHQDSAQQHISSHHTVMIFIFSRPEGLADCPEHGNKALHCRLLCP